MTVLQVPLIDYAIPSRGAYVADWQEASVAFGPGDLPGLRVLAQIHSAVIGGDMTRAGELRRWMDDYGLTPAGKQARRWKPPEAEKSQPAASTSGSYNHLRVVEGQ
jgi:hypothetical protein